MRYRPFASPSVQSENLPAMAAFLDDLPSIDDFLAVDAVSEGEELSDLPIVRLASQAGEITTAQREEDGWAPADWQSFDWTRLGSLGRQIEFANAEADWSATEWAPENRGYDEVSRNDIIGSRAKEVAEALDDIARRIRSGELYIGNLHGAPLEAALAAALAALFKMRG